MNRKGIFEVGMALLMILFVIVLTLFATIEPFKESLDSIRGTSSLNCPNTPNFNSTQYGEDTSFEKLVRRPTCFVTGVSMVWFVSFVLFAAVTWVVANWRKK